MKKIRTAFLLLFMLASISASYSQFYDVKIIKKPRVVGTRGESDPLLSEKTGQTPEKNTHRFNKMDGDALKDPSDSTQSAELSDSLGTESKRMVFCAPLDTLIVSSPYGYRKDPFTGKRKFHAGTDYVTSTENVYAMMPGRVRKIGYDKRLGNYITIDHGDIRVTYAHLHTVVGEKDDIVQAGQSVGISGSTGRSTGEHLHVSVRYKKKVVDPDPIIRAVKDYAKIL